MNTPICDFVTAYRERETLRLHMPGHKGRGGLGVESMDITEIAGADELYHARGVIRQSEDSAAALFGAARTVYSAEGSSLCIRAMLYLARMEGQARGRKPLILAGRNAHQTFLSAAALLDMEVAWLYPENGGLMACPVDGERLEGALRALPDKPAAVYVTTPDYLGHLLDVADLARVCRRHQVPLLVDNAHGAYLRFLPRDRHPISLGADLCCDSGHKTLPVLTGGAYLHLAPTAPDLFFQQAERAMALFASTSPSYLILQSLDRCNAYLAGPCREELAALVRRAADMKKRLESHGFSIQGEEPAKLTIAPKSFGYTGEELHDLLRGQNMECEFSDPDYLTMMLTPSLGGEEMDRLERALLGIPRKGPIAARPPALPPPERALSIRQAMLAPSREISLDEAEGRVFADAHGGCPPCVPIVTAGERLSGAAIACLRYYGVSSCFVVDGV